jgi:hypothetical protein
MKFKIFLSLIALVATTAISQPAAQADGARFKFPVNYYKIEEPRYPHSAYIPPAQPTVRAGSTPSASSMLGPLANLKRPPAPAVQAAPVQQPNVMAQLVPAAWNNAFGKPQAQQMPLTASPKAMAQVAQAAQPKAIKSTSVPRSLSRSQNGTAHLRRPSYPQSRVARANQIQSYPTGYTPGSTAPTNVGGGYSTSATVGGKIIRH